MHNDLTLIENDLVPVYQTDTGERVVYGSDLHRVLEVRSNYREWSARRIMDLSMEENVDYQVMYIPISTPNPRKDHIISLNSALEICLSEKTEVAKRIRKSLCNIKNKSNSNINTLEINRDCKSIYVVKDEEKCKIGVSYNPSARYKAIKISNPLCELIYYSSPVFNAFELEAHLHKQLTNKGFHIQGEWFRIEDIDQLCKNIDNIIRVKGQFSKRF